MERSKKSQGKGWRGSLGACREVFTHCHGSIFNMLKTDVTSRVLQEADCEMEHTGCLLRALFNHQYLWKGEKRRSGWGGRVRLQNRPSDSLNCDALGSSRVGMALHNCFPWNQYGQAILPQCGSLTECGEGLALGCGSPLHWDDPLKGLRTEDCWPRAPPAMEHQIFHWRAAIKVATTTSTVRQMNINSASRRRVRSCPTGYPRLRLNSLNWFRIKQVLGLKGAVRDHDTLHPFTDLPFSHYRNCFIFK